MEPRESYEKAWTITKEIYQFLQDHLINCVLQPTGGRGIHIWAKEDFIDPPDKYQTILDHLGIKGEKVCDLYGFNRVLGKAIGVRLLRDKPKYIKNRYSIAPRTPKKHRFYKVLVDTPCVPKGAVRVPLSRHSGSGLTDWRVASSSGVKALNDYTGFKQSCQPRNAVTYARNHRTAYQHFAPRNHKGDFNLLTKELEKEIFLVLYAHQDPDHDYDWALHTNQDDTLYTKWMQ